MKRGQSPYDEAEGNQERWLISYADFITLMFAFFVILYATSERDIQKTKGFQNSIDRYLIKAGSFGESGSKIEQGEKNFTVIAPPIETFRQNKADDRKLMDAMESTIEARLTDAERKRFLIDLAPEDQGVRVIISGHELFSAETAKFSPNAMEFIDHLGQILKDQKKHIMIEGHVGENSKGTFASPWDLAAARSINLLRYMEKKFEFSGPELAATTFGDSRPLSKAKNLEVSKNDRVEFLVYYTDSDF